MDHRQLLEDLLTSFSEIELKGLCLQLQISFEDLDGRNRGDKAQSLISFLEREGRISDLAQLMIKEKPVLATHYLNDDELSWLDQVAGGELTPVEELPTLKWPGPDQSKVAMIMEGGEPARVMGAEETPTMTWADEDEFLYDSASGTSSILVDNPYKAGTMVTEKSMFFGRSEELKHLIDAIQQTQSVAVTGLSRIGKSSLLYYLRHHYPFPSSLKVVLAYVNPKDDELKSVSVLYNRILTEWYRDLMDAPAPSATTAADFARQVRTLHGAGFRAVVLLDEFEGVLANPAEFDDKVFESWYRLASSGQILFIAASKRQLSELANGHLANENGAVSDFIKLFDQLELSLLEESAALSLLVKPAESNGIKVPESIARDVLSLSGHHPHFLQLAGGILFAHLAKRSYKFEILRTEFARQAEFYWRELWQSLSPQQQNSISIPLSKNAPLVIRRQYRSLVEKGVLVQIDDGHRFFSQGFADRINSLMADNQ